MNKQAIKTCVDMYLNEYYTIQEIADYLHCSRQYVALELKKAGYQFGKLPRAGYKDPRCRNKEQFFAICQKHCSVENIGRELNISASSVTKWMKHHSISKKILQPRVGEKHHSWKGGYFVGNDGYAWVSARECGYLEFNPSWKTHNVPEHSKIIEMDVLKQQLPDEYVVHHIDENRSNNEIDNLAILTRSQHMMIHNKLRADGDKEKIADVARLLSNSNQQTIKASKLLGRLI